MEDFNSKYTGQQVEDLLDQVANGEVGGGTANVQADWNVSDTTSDSYIKNRTHYAEFSQVSIPTTLNTNSWTEVKLSGITGQTLYVKYSYPPSNIAAATTLSMNDLGVERTFNNGPNFTIYRGITSIYIKGFYDENHILEVTTVVNKLPEYFIPSNIARTSELSGKQDTLVSGENIKTINGESILGSGNITISGGSSGGGEIETISLYGNYEEPIVIDEMLAEKRYHLYADGGTGDVQEIAILGFEGHSADGPTTIRHFYAVIESFKISGAPMGITIGFPADCRIQYPNGILPQITTDCDTYELSITQVNEYGVSFYNVVFTPFKI